MGIGSFLLGLWPQRWDRDDSIAITIRNSGGKYLCDRHGWQDASGQWKKLGPQKYRTPCGCVWTISKG